MVKLLINLLNKLKKLISEEIAAFKKEKYDQEFQKFLKASPSETRFWKKIKEFDSVNDMSKLIPFLIHNGKKVFSDQIKCDLFSLKLESIFKPYSDPMFDEGFKNVVDEQVKSDSLFAYQNHNKKFEENFSSIELDKQLKKLPLKSAPGIDKLNNKLLTNIGPQVRLNK
ncbi:hypothetical protein BpHYR1_032603 [Brachionus plicatilis]|uniref:Uncharacterized protein n=1 Tax=Brachionus plicatilis TaxID=10195 RepID=A0A3M7QZ32_BRAPC|nr:hypothetical protein BpHYR1_032603 [Brachionus plicatilis]